MNDSNTVDSDLLFVTREPEVNLSILNGYVKTCKKLEPTEEYEEAERVGVLEYMPSCRYRSAAKCSGETLKAEVSLPLHQNSNSCQENTSENAAEATSCSRDIEHEASSIAESCSDSFGKSCASSHNAQCSTLLLSDDDELLDPVGTEAEEEPQAVVTRSQQQDCTKAPSSHATSNRRSLGVDQLSTADREVATFCHSPSTFDVARDVAWSNPDTTHTSPTDSPEPVEQVASYSVSSHSVGGKLCLTDRIDRQGPGSSRYQSPVDESGKISEVHLGGGNLQPVEMLSMDRHQVEPNSLSRQNVVFLNEYPFWQSTRALYRDDSAAVVDRSEVEKRQERRDKRKKVHSLPVALAKDVAGYVGEGKTIEELIDYITRTDGKSQKSKQKAFQHRQTESKKLPAAAKSTKKAQVPKTRPKLSKTTVSRNISDAGSAVDELVTSKPIEDSEMALPGSGPTEILTVSDGSVWKTAPVINSASSDLVNASEDAKCWRKMSHEMKQHNGVYGSGEDLSEELVGGLTRTASEIGLLFYPTSLSAPAVKDISVDARNSNLQMSSLENGATARTNTQINTGAAPLDDGLSTQADNSTHSKSCEMLFSKVKKSPTSDRAASTVILTPPVNHPQRVVPSVSLSRSASNSEYSYQDETVLLSEENGPWEEFQSKKKRSRNHGQQSVVRNPMLSARRSSSSGSAVPVSSQKKTALDSVSVMMMMRHTDGAIDAARGHRVPFTTGNFPETVSQDIHSGNVWSAIDVDSNDKLSESMHSSTANSPKSSSNNSHLGSDVLVSNCLRGTEFSVHRKDECSTYARMASRDSNSISFRSKTGPSVGFLSFSKQPDDIVCGKNRTEAEAFILDDKTKKSNASDQSGAALLEENKLGTAKKQQMEKKFDNLRCEMSETFDNKPNGRLSANLSKVKEASDAIARPPAVVFCGKGSVKTGFGKESCGISFEYSDEPASGKAKSFQSFLVKDLATGNTSDVRVASGCFHQVSRSCEATSSSSGVVNCGRPIAPLSGTGHASSTKTPVLIVSPLPKVLQQEETTTYIVDADPERLKEATACVRHGISTEVKEPAMQISVWSALARPLPTQELVSVDGGVVVPSSLPAEIRETSDKVPMKVTPKKTHLEPNHARRTKPSHASNKVSTFNALDAAQYLAVDWERLLSEGSLVYYLPDQQ